jgi:hypothetical protein
LIRMDKKSYHANSRSQRIEQGPPGGVYFLKELNKNANAWTLS